MYVCMFVCMNINVTRKMYGRICGCMCLFISAGVEKIEFNIFLMPTECARSDTVIPHPNTCM